MIKDINVKLDYNRDYQIAGQSIHLPVSIPYKAIMVLVNTMVMVLLKNDGVMRENVMMKSPLLVFEMIDNLTDFDMAAYKEGKEDVILQLYEDAWKVLRYEYAFTEQYEEIMQVYEETSKELKRQAREENGFGAQLRDIGKYLTGDGTVKDLGLIRKILTDFLLKNNNKEIQPQTPAVKENDSVIDLSKYKIKGEKK